MANHGVARMDAHERIGTLGDAERIELGIAGLQTFFHIATLWQLTQTDQQVLLGDIGRSTRHEWRERPPRSTESYTVDRLTRLSYLLGVYGMLQQLYGETPAFADAWIRSPNRNPVFGGEPPLKLMREGGIPGLQVVRRFLEAQAGGTLAGPGAEVVGPTAEPSERAGLALAGIR